jgi:hypothetical protein
VVGRNRILAVPARDGGNGRLPGFDGLVRNLYDALATIPNPIQRAAIKAKQFDAAIGLLEADMVCGRETMRQALPGILTTDLRAPNATATHGALPTLAKGREGRTVREFNRHTYLHKTLRAWANTYRDGVRGKESTVVECAMARPSSDSFSPHPTLPARTPAKRTSACFSVPQLSRKRPTHLSSSLSLEQFRQIAADRGESVVEEKRHCPQSLR